MIIKIDRHNRVQRGRPGRLRPDFDRLEYRLALSGAGSSFGFNSGSVGSMSPNLASGARAGSLGVVSTNPAPSSNLTASTRSITISFNRPIDSFSVNSADFEVDRLADDGMTWLPLAASSVLEELDPSDSTQSRILLTVDSDLADGDYQVLLKGSNQLQGLDGTVDNANGQDQVVDQFRVASTAGGLSGAIDLGTVSHLVSVVSGSLDLSANPDDVALYKLELSPGDFQRLGLEISSLSDGGALTTTLSLFDSHENLIATSVKSPNDPYLFGGLEPGTYYVGVSGADNVPDASGGYPQSSLATGSLADDPTGDAFQLHFVSDVVTRPTSVLGVTLDHADPDSTSPTGFTLQFSGTIQTTGLLNSTTPAVTLVDQSGQDWPVTPINYDASTARLSYVLNQDLPAGQYTVELGGAGELVDLAGLTPVAKGEPDGVLGSFSLTSGIRTSNDLGVLLPGLAQTGIDASTVIEPDATFKGQFTVVRPGVYLVDQGDDPLGLTVTSSTQGSSVGSVIVSTKTPEGDQLILPAGVYTISVTNDEEAAVPVELRIFGKQTPFTSLLESGVGQGPALNLRLISPSAGGQNMSASASASASAWSGPPSASAGNPLAPVEQVGRGGASSGFVDSSMVAVVPGSLVGSTIGFVVVGTPVGRPTVQTDRISFLGMASNSFSGEGVGMNSDGLPGGPVFVPVAISLGTTPEPSAPRLDSMAPGPDVQGTKPGTSLTMIPPPSDGRYQADEGLTSDSDWANRLFTWLSSRWDGPLELRPEASPSPESVQVVSASPLAMVDEQLEVSKVEVASLASPIVVGVVAYAAIQYRRRKATLAQGEGQNISSLMAGALLRGPHRRRFYARH